MDLFPTEQKSIWRSWTCRKHDTEESSLTCCSSRLNYQKENNSKSHPVAAISKPPAYEADSHPPRPVATQIWPRTSTGRGGRSCGHPFTFHLKVAYDFREDSPTNWIVWIKFLWLKSSSNLAQIHHLRPRAGDTVLRISGAACLVEGEDPRIRCKVCAFWRAYWIDWRCFYYIYVYIYNHPRTQMGAHILEDLTHEMEGQTSKKVVSWVLGLYIFTCYVWCWIFWNYHFLRAAKG